MSTFKNSHTILHGGLGSYYIDLKHSEFIIGDSTVGSSSFSLILPSVSSTGPFRLIEGSKITIEDPFGYISGNGPKIVAHPNDTLIYINGILVTGDNYYQAIKTSKASYTLVYEGGNLFTLTQGAPATTGAQGSQGNQGSNGPQGNTGAQGNQGPDGFQGNTGPQGSQGRQGPQGNQGPTGDQGAQGRQGPQGNQGPTGQQGVQGPGGTGPQGIQGSAGSAVALNYAAEQGAQITTSTNGTTLVSKSFTATGNPIQLIGSGDANPLSAGGWGKLQFYRNSTAIGPVIQYESSAANENVPYSLNHIDTPAAGTYTYSLKVIEIAGGNVQFGEANGAYLTLVELGGALGYQGTQGLQGLQGNIGNQGALGAQGRQGPTGIQGTTGSQGNQGPTGPQGFTGSQGNQGPTGFQGNQGPTGLQGTTGSQGNQGPTGQQGSQGNQGPTGQQGQTGLQGTTGAQGNQGPTGQQGTQGNQGPTGPQGFTGSQGNQGPTGPQGFQGRQGPQGVQGPAGLDGAAGSNGAQGAAGTNGSNGSSGPQGNQGPSGPQGNTGADSSVAGPQGRQGPTGTGTQGNQGPNGPQGNQGPNGPQGNQGPTGTGAQGPQGSSGYLNVSIPHQEIMYGYDGTVSSTSAITVDAIAGTVYANGFYQNSSRSLKTNITEYTDSATDLLNSINVVSFNYKTDLENKHIGFIAEDTPIELSTKNQNKMDSNSTIGVLIKAIQELSLEVNRLRDLYEKY